MTRRVMVYSHDTFGLGNIRRMLSIATDLLQNMTDTSVLLVTGSPMVQSFRLTPGLDYIKLPCLSRISRDEYSAKSLGTGIEQTMRLRSALIEAATRDFAPDVVLIDKKPDGVQRELRGTLDILHRSFPRTKVGLILRDILDAPETTTASWRDKGYPDLIRKYFESILILGSPEVFDSRREYEFSPQLRRMTRFCGYLHRATAAKNAGNIRATWMEPGEKRLVLVTPGGGEDGYPLVRDYLLGIRGDESNRTVVVYGPEMPLAERQAVISVAAKKPRVTVCEFTPDLPALMSAADLVVSMAGYNTVCEILSLGKRSVVVPRVHPVREQWIRAERLAARGLLTSIHPDQLSPETMAAAVRHELARAQGDHGLRAGRTIDMNGLSNVRQWVLDALREGASSEGDEKCKAVSLTY